jgi:serine/threonine-protein kinase
MKTHLGHYEIVAELGRGGMGVVYKGYEPSLARYVAIKELSPTLAHEAAVVERFLREARSMAMLNDPHIIQIYSIGQENEQPFFVMEFVDGLSVAGLILREGHLSSGDAMKIVHQTAQGLASAHDRGVIHRDVKPANLIVSQRGQVKIADFGIALANADMNAKLTSAGEMVGTPGYLPPETLLGNPVDQRSDLYSLGVVLFEMLTGRTPFSDASVYKLMLSVVQSEVPDVREINAEIDPGVAAILAKMLMKDPVKRYQSMHDLISDLEKHPLIANGGPITTKLTPANTAADTAVGMAMPMTPGAAPRPPTPPPEMRRSGPAVTPSHAPEPAAAPAPAATQKRTRPGLGSAAAAESDVPKKKSTRLLLIAALGLLLLAGAGWMLRGQLFGPPPSETVAVDTTGQDAERVGQPGKTGKNTSDADGKPATAWYLPYAQRVQASFLDAREVVVEQLRPALRQMGIKLAPELVFNLLLVVLLILLYRSVHFRIARARDKRAYAKRSRRTV